MTLDGIRRYAADAIAPKPKPIAVITSTGRERLDSFRLPDSEYEVLNALADRAMTCDDLAHYLGRPKHKVQNVLKTLELSGSVKRRDGGGLQEASNDYS